MFQSCSKPINARSRQNFDFSIDFKLEFGRLPDGTVILADEISPDNCRLWQVGTDEKMDKDRFRRDLGGLTEAYQEIARRLGLVVPQQG